MAELSTNKARVSQQDRPVYRRDGILPRRQGPDASPQRRDNIDIRAARRSDAGAEAVMRLAQQVNGAFESFQEYKQQKFIYDEKENALKAVGDFNTGNVDTGLMEESVAYKAAYSLSKIEAEMTEAKPRMLQRAQSVIDGYKGADLEELMASVDKVVGEELGGLVSDGNGGVRDLGTAQAFAIASNRIGQLERDTRADALTLGRKRIADNGRSVELARGLAEVRAGGVLDINRMTESLRVYGLNDTQMEETFIELIEVVDKEDPAKAAALSSQLLGLPTGVKALRAPTETTTTTTKMVPTGKLPVSGKIMSRLGDGRNHNGIDIDAKIGDPVEAPAGGKVIKVDPNPNQRAGVHVVIDHGNGVTSSYSHLNSADVAVGDVIRPGQRIATVGNTGNVKRGPNGDGSHLHWVVRNGKQIVNPLEFQFPEYEGQVSTTQVAGPTPDAPPTATVTLPPGFKLSAAGIARLSGVREAAVERTRVLGQRAEQERHEASSEAIYKDILSGSYPTDQRLTEMAERGDISWDMAANFKTAREQKARADRAEAEGREDRALRNANMAADRVVADIALDWRLNGGPKSMAEFHSYIKANRSKLGEGANWLQNYNLLYGVVSSNEARTTGDPDYRMHMSMVKNLFGRPTGLGRVRGTTGGDPNTTLRAQERFRHLVVVEGKRPEEAYGIVAQENGKTKQAKPASELQSVDADLEALAARRGAR